jgi:hypothetical protein
MAWAAVLVLFASLLATPAIAAPQPNPFPPPARYDRPFHGKTYIHYQSLNTILLRCWGTCWAYTYIPPPGARECHMYIPRVDGRRVNATGQRALIRHERGHCNGWPPNHPA